MENEMVERVARAIWINRNSGATDADWCAALEAARKGRRNTDVHDVLWDARAAIEAMREPTEGMIKAADKEDVEYDRVGSRIHWAAMIDAALTPETQKAPRP